MPRLSFGEKSHYENRILGLIRGAWYGLRESDIASELGWGRRRVNNYLRRLQNRGLIYREGWKWFADK
jgi:predicted transcriptional regulator